jgi:hypothetical protein
MTQSAARKYALVGITLVALCSTLTAGEWQCDGHWLQFRGKAFTVNLAPAKNMTFIVRWYDPRTGQFHDAGRVMGGNAAQSFTPPLEGDPVLHLQGQGTRP